MVLNVAEFLKRAQLPSESLPAEIGKPAYFYEGGKKESDTGFAGSVLLGKVISIDANSNTAKFIPEERQFFHLRYQKTIAGKDLNGHNLTNWYCIPMQPFCMSKVDFPAWEGKHTAGETITVALKYVNKNGAFLVAEQARVRLSPDTAELMQLDRNVAKAYKIAP